MEFRRERRELPGFGGPSGQPGVWVDATRRSVPGAVPVAPGAPHIAQASGDVAGVDVNQAHVHVFRCPACSGMLSVWDVRGREKDEIAEGALACQSCGETYRIHARLPILLPSGRRAVDDLSTALATEAAKVGFAESVRRLASGAIEYPLREPFGRPITSTEEREALYRENEAFWATLSRSRLVQQQLNAIDRHWDALEEVWLRAELNLAERVLDVGSGWGGTLQHLLERGPQDALVIALDTAFLNLKVAQGRAERAGFEHAVFVVGDITVPPFAPDLFDAVVSWFGIGSIPLLHAGLEGVAHVLAPRGSFAAAWTPLIDDMEGLAGRDDLVRFAERLDVPVSPDDTCKAAEEAGLEEVELTSVGPIYVLSGRRSGGAAEA